MASSKQLTAELVMFKTKTNNLDKIRNLNLCANDLQEISIVSEMGSLEVLSLSVNNIHTLKDIAECPNLQELYIRRNNIDRIEELDYLQKL
jgi:cilla- and flagella-associated protein